MFLGAAFTTYETLEVCEIFNAFHCLSVDGVLSDVEALMRIIFVLSGSMRTPVHFALSLSRPDFSWKSLRVDDRLSAKSRSTGFLRDGLMLFDASPSRW